MEKSYQTLNEILVVLFHDIMDIEQDAIITGEFQDISNNDMHIIEAVGVDRPKNMSSIAKRLSVTMGTLTTAMNSLVKKGYVNRNRSEQDRRVVFISLTEKGNRAYEQHAQFHSEMIEAVVQGMGDTEKEILIQSLERLNAFFIKYKR